MSKTLRRPMFRGGRVASYGTGIAAPLVPGYQSGGQIGGGIIHGLPYEDGRYGFARPKLQNFNTDFILPEMKVGQEIYEETREKPWLSQDLELPVITEQESALDTAGEIDEVYQEPKVNTTDEYITLPPRGRSKESITIKNPDYEPPFKTVTSPGKGRIGKVTREVELTDEEIEAEKWSPSVGGEEFIPNISDTLKVNEEIIETKPEVDARTAVAENKALFADLLDIKKARGQDISEMLLGFAGAEGDTVWDKSKAFFREEARRPGRRQKISDAAGTLAIQDYIAGKRSKEQIEGYKGKIDYEYDKKFEMLMPSTDDTLQVAKTKLLANKQDPNSAKGIKYLIGIQDPENAENVFAAKKGLKWKDIEKKKSKILKYLHTGYNILVDADTGTKMIITYDGSGTVEGVGRITLTELWAKA